MLSVVRLPRFPLYSQSTQSFKKHFSLEALRASFFFFCLGILKFHSVGCRSSYFKTWPPNSLTFFLSRDGVLVPFSWIWIGLGLRPQGKSTGSDTGWLLRLDYKRSCPFTLVLWNACSLETPTWDSSSWNLNCLIVKSQDHEEKAYDLLLAWAEISHRVIPAQVPDAMCGEAFRWLYPPAVWVTLSHSSLPSGGSRHHVTESSHLCSALSEFLTHKTMSIIQWLWF